MPDSACFIVPTMRFQKKNTSDSIFIWKATKILNIVPRYKGFQYVVVTHNIVAAKLVVDQMVPTDANLK